MQIMVRLRNWFRRKPRPSPGGFDTTIIERERRYRELREGMLALLYVHAKLRGAGARAQLIGVRKRLRTLSEEMAACRAEIEQLELCRLDAAAEVAFTRAC
jgi:hypothetical protein